MRPEYQPHDHVSELNLKYSSFKFKRQETIPKRQPVQPQDSARLVEEVSREVEKFGDSVETVVDCKPKEQTYEREWAPTKGTCLSQTMLKAVKDGEGSCAMDKGEASIRLHRPDRKLPPSRETSLWEQESIHASDIYRRTLSPATSKAPGSQNGRSRRQDNVEVGSTAEVQRVDMKGESSGEA
ncbi:hypothetical protein PRZ48_011154 [Zasmidium cellare]|uniref:Uncharacterized protein n=1 Tax=Zasmidium cellare TaxID=395010 RepID=A0ABR0EAL5_ZASCE|nr:hypothetical protein PRZ48_011154 [Zasmidium cellare]